MFDLGQTYTRDAIHDAIGGSKQACLVQHDGQVIAVCYVPEMNPQGPRVILVGKGPQKEAAAAILASQATGVPVFAKKQTGKWEHMGVYKGETYIPSCTNTACYVEGSGRKDIAGVLLLAPNK